MSKRQPCATFVTWTCFVPRFRLISNSSILRFHVGYRHHWKAGANLALNRQGSNRKSSTTSIRNSHRSSLSNCPASPCEQRDNPWTAHRFTSPPPPLSIRLPGQFRYVQFHTTGCAAPEPEIAMRHSCRIESRSSPSPHLIFACENRITTPSSVWLPLSNNPSTPVLGTRSVISNPPSSSGKI